MAVHQLTCRGCGNQFQFHRRKAYCSFGCRASVQTKGTDQHANAACRQEHECNVCGKAFTPKRAGRTTTCSRECGLVWSGFKTTAKLNGGRVWVRTIRNKPQPIKAEAKTYYTPVVTGTCRHCLCRFNRTNDGASRFMCSEECALRAKRAARSGRRSLKRGAQVSGPVDPIAVFDRDGWRCQMCRVRTPMTKRGTYEDTAPELDHIMPLSRGGEHSYRNTQCLCRSCNAKKSDTPMGQLVLL